MNYVTLCEKYRCLLKGAGIVNSDRSDISMELQFKTEITSLASRKSCLKKGGIISVIKICSSPHY